MIDVENEAAISLTAATKLIPGRPHISTVWRWTASGAHGIKLETFAVGGRRFTTKEAIGRFIAATTAAAKGEPTPSRTAKQRERSLQEADQVLDRFLGSSKV